LPGFPGRTHPHRVLLQLPDTFDPARACLLVAPASGSRGVYGAIALAGAWGLPRGCAVVYTDKGAGSGYFDLASASGVALDGSRSSDAELEFRVDGGASTPLIAVKHAHSRENPEADWGLHVLQAARFGLSQIGAVYPGLGDGARVRVIAVGLSNGGGAVLRALERDEDGLFDAVVAAAPNITPEGAPALYDYATLAALYQPCLLASAELRAAMSLSALNPDVAGPRRGPLPLTACRRRARERGAGGRSTRGARTAAGRRLHPTPH
jgi:hydroxybutyrate-dimer hydrolase